MHETMLAERRDAGAREPDWWRGAVIYQIYPRSFQDASGDGIGDLAGISQRLDYVADLGVDAIWVSPFFTSPMKDFGYDVADYRGVDPLFGTIDDFEGLLHRAHNLGLKVIIDQVLSHTSDQHAWFQESRHDRTNPRADWYVWADARPDGTPPNNWLSIFGGSAWTWDPRRTQYYFHNFLAAQPDLNFHNPEVREAILGECRFWLDRGVDGFRLDTVNFYFHAEGLESNPPIDASEFNDSIAPAVNPYNLQNHIHDKSQDANLDFLRDLRALLEKYPGTTTVGEVGDAQRQLELVASYTGGGDKLHMAYTFDFLGGRFEPGYFREKIGEMESLADDGWPCWAFSNHDVARHLSRWKTGHGDEEALAKLAAMVLSCLRGSICIYQGEELGLGEADLSFEDLVDPYGIEFWPNYKGRDGCRTPMVWQADAHLGAFSPAPKAWLPVPADHLGRSVDRQTDDENSVLNFYRRAIAFRHEHPALVKGGFELVGDHAAVFAFTRRHPDETLVCAFNMSGEAAELELDTPAPGDDLIGFGEGTGRTGRTVSLAPFGGYVGALPSR